MKKSMFALFGCALVAGSVMAADVTGNNTAVVIQKAAVVSSNLYQFLVVPVKGFDITGNGEGQDLSLDEILPPSLYYPNTIVYQNGTTNVMKVQEVQGVRSWVKDKPEKNFEPKYAAGTILWLQAAPGTEINDIPETVFCGELSAVGVTVDPTGTNEGVFVPFGNATSLAVKFSEISVNSGFKKNDKIYLVKGGSSDYMILNYNGTVWTKPPAGSGAYVPVNETDTTKELDLLPPGAAAYYYRRKTN